MAWAKQDISFEACVCYLSSFFLSAQTTPLLFSSTDSHSHNRNTHPFYPNSDSLSLLFPFSLQNPMTLSLHTLMRFKIQWNSSVYSKYGICTFHVRYVYFVCLPTLKPSSGSCSCACVCGLVTNKMFNIHWTLRAQPCSSFCLMPRFNFFTVQIDTPPIEASWIFLLSYSNVFFKFNLIWFIHYCWY